MGSRRGETGILNKSGYDRLEKLRGLISSRHLHAGLNAGNELKTHYSLGWHWFEGGDVDFNGERKNVLEHMIDLFDTTDMQTAYVIGSEMVNRMQKGFNGTAAVG